MRLDVARISPVAFAAASAIRSSLIINVEYNQLDPILRATISPEGDVNNPSTGLSPFPGNTNNLVFMLDPYLKARKKEGNLMRGVTRF